MIARLELTQAEAQQKLGDAFSIARRYGTHFTLPMFLALVCQVLKHWHYRSDHALARSEIERIIAFVNRAGLKVPIDWCDEETVMQVWVVNTSWYEEVRAMLLCMRALVAVRYPAEIHDRWEGLTREEILRDGMAEVMRQP